MGDQKITMPEVLAITDPRTVLLQPGLDAGAFVLCESERGGELQFAFRNEDDHIMAENLAVRQKGFGFEFTPPDTKRGPDHINLDAASLNGDCATKTLGYKRAINEITRMIEAHITERLKDFDSPQPVTGVKIRRKHSGSTAAATSSEGFGYAYTDEKTLNEIAAHKQGRPIAATSIADYNNIDYVRSALGTSCKPAPPIKIAPDGESNYASIDEDVFGFGDLTSPDSDAVSITSDDDHCQQAEVIFGEEQKQQRFSRFGRLGSIMSGRKSGQTALTSSVLGKHTNAASSGEAAFYSYPNSEPGGPS